MLALLSETVPSPQLTVAEKASGVQFGSLLVNVAMVIGPVSAPSVAVIVLATMLPTPEAPLTEMAESLTIQENVCVVTPPLPSFTVIVAEAPAVFSAASAIVPEITPRLESMVSPSGKPSTLYVNGSPLASLAESAKLTVSPTTFVWLPGLVKVGAVLLPCVIAQLKLVLVVLVPSVTDNAML